MINRIAAGWLALLVLLPFTPPFPTCTFADFFGGSSSHSTVTNPPVGSRPAALADGADLLVMPLRNVADELTLQAVLGAGRPGAPPVATIAFVPDALPLALTPASGALITVLRL